MMYYDLIYYNYGLWVAYETKDGVWLCESKDREACITMVESMGYIWSGE